MCMAYALRMHGKDILPACVLHAISFNYIYMGTLDRAGGSESNS